MKTLAPRLSLQHSGLTFWLQLVVLLLVVGPLWLFSRDLFDGSIISQARAFNNPDGLYLWLMSARSEERRVGKEC